MNDSATTSTALKSYDLFAPDVLGDPLPLLHRIRAESPVSWIPELESFLVTRHADVVAALKDKRLVPGNLGQAFDRLSPAELAELEPVRQSIALWMGHTDEKDHVRFQQLLKRYFTPATVEGLRPRIREIAIELIEARREGGFMEVVTELAYPLPANVIAEMLGMPTADREKLQEWSRDLLALFQLADFETLRQSQRSILEMQDYVRALVAQRREEARDDLLSMFVAAEREGLVSEDEIVANCVLLLFAGHETTANLIAMGLGLLLEDQGQFDRLKADHGLIPTAVEEMLRVRGPASTLVRIATEPVEVAGTTYPAGSHFLLAMVSGNHDPEVFENPDTFDIGRKPNRHTAFGMGAFYCLGAALARAETAECLDVVLERMPDIRPAYDEISVVSSPPLSRHLASLPVFF
ncbi:cytochrome P450 [Saccharothrix violaceirubra]|uniref:Cytochrome P450 n=1 Tax=Saccharothrix violaceirubra TaxID=413306 RepID=A0A7W7WWR6_9PSEU|nr:cytochrome P450 [Saccharothrix violaceirubra]MBB4966635.1 cytochrome P450 [Saccharothrix violaceirubra]